MLPRQNREKIETTRAYSQVNPTNSNINTGPNFINLQVFDGIKELEQSSPSPSPPLSNRHNIHLVPTISVGLDSMCIGVIAVSLIGLLGVARGSRRLMNLFNCRGFNDGEDRSLETSTEGYEGHLPSCSGILEQTFGKRLEHLGATIFWIRFIQLAGVLLLSMLFKYLAIMDQSDLDKEGSLEEAQHSHLLGDSKSGYYLTEKQMADSDAHVPLLLCQEEQEEEEVLEMYADDDGEDDASVVSSDDGSQITIVVA
ncbi:hypothetical protein EC991_004838 [Linnemannia zychae]|nr:hypothetical protein EC991_004838 [Linnemannia zychae]